MSCLDCEAPAQVKSIAEEMQREETRDGEGARREEKLKRRVSLRSWSQTDF